MLENQGLKLKSIFKSSNYQFVKEFNFSSLFQHDVKTLTINRKNYLTMPAKYFNRYLFITAQNRISILRSGQK